MGYFVVGCVVGIMISIIFTLIKNHLIAATGVFRIDHSNPNKDIYRLDLDGVILDNKTKLILKIDHTAYLGDASRE